MKDQNVIKILKLSNNEAETLIKGISQDSSKVVLTTHVRERMCERGVTLKQILQCLSRFRIVEEPHRTPKGNWKLTIEAQSMDDWLKIVLCLDNASDGNYIVIVTVIKIN